MNKDQLRQIMTSKTGGDSMLNGKYAIGPKKDAPAAADNGKGNPDGHHDDDDRDL